jgi:hypothetical protein
VSVVLASVTLVIVASAVFAVSSRDARIAVLALAICLVCSVAASDPVPAPLGVAARLIGSLLGIQLLWIAVRDRRTSGPVIAATGGSRIGWPAELLVGASAAIVGFSAHGLGAPANGPALASAAGFAVAALAVPPMLTGRDVLRMTTGLFLLVDAGLLVRTGLGGTPDPLEQLITAGLFVAIGGTTAALTMAARGDGSGGLEFASEATVRRRETAAHPIDDDVRHVVEPR